MTPLSPAKAAPAPTPASAPTEQLVRAKQGPTFGWGCMPASFSPSLTGDIPALLDGDTSTDAWTSRDRLTVVRFANNQVRNGGFELHWAPGGAQKNRYSFGYSSDGITFTRMGQCDQYNGVKASITDSMVVNAPTASFKYFALAAAGLVSPLREITWIEVSP